MTTITQITEKNMQALQLPGRHDFNGQFMEGADKGRHFDMYAINADSFQIAAIGADRNTDIARVRPADSPGSVKGYLITFHELQGARSNQITHGLIDSQKRTDVIALCEKISHALESGDIPKAVAALKERAVEFHQN
jgi:hypothetical protein